MLFTITVISFTYCNFLVSRPDLCRLQRFRPYLRRLGHSSILFDGIIYCSSSCVLLRLTLKR